VLLGAPGLRRGAGRVEGTAIIRNKDRGRIRDHRRVDHGSDIIRVDEARVQPVVGPCAKSPPEETRVAPGGEEADWPSPGPESHAERVEPAAEVVPSPTPSIPVAEEGGVEAPPTGPAPPPEATPPVVEEDVVAEPAASPTPT